MENFTCNQYGERFTILSTENIKIWGWITKLETIKVEFVCVFFHIYWKFEFLISSQGSVAKCLGVVGSGNFSLRHSVEDEVNLLSKVHVNWCTIVETLPVLRELLRTLFPHILEKLNATSCHRFSFIDTLTWIFLFSIAQHELLWIQYNSILNAETIIWFPCAQRYTKGPACRETVMPNFCNYA